MSSDKIIVVFTTNSVNELKDVVNYFKTAKMPSCIELRFFNESDSDSDSDSDYDSLDLLQDANFVFADVTWSKQAEGLCIGLEQGHLRILEYCNQSGIDIRLYCRGSCQITLGYLPDFLQTKQIHQFMYESVSIRNFYQDSMMYILEVVGPKAVKNWR